MTTRFRFKGSASGLALATIAALGIGLLSLKPLVAKAKDDDKVFSHAFRNASAQQVLAWMASEGIQVKVERDQLPGRLMSFAFDGMNRDDLVLSFSRMVGLQAEKRGDVYSLMKGVGGDGPAEHLGSEGTQEPCPGTFQWMAPVIEDQERELARVIDPQFAMPLEELALIEAQQVDVKALVEEVLKAVEESGAKLTDQQKTKLRATLAEKLAKANAHSFMVAPDGNPFLFKMDEGQMKKWQLDQEKAMVELKKQMEELKKSGKMPEGGMFFMGPDGVHQWDSKEYERAMEELHKHLGELHGDGKFFFMGPEGAMKMDGEQHKKAMEELKKHIEELKAKGMYKEFDHEAFKKQMEEMHKQLGGEMKVLQLKLENIKKFVDSLTPAQKALADKQGYLRPEDLTKQQRELLGIGSDGDTDMSFQIDGKKIVIKSKGSAPARKGVVTA